MLVSHANAKSTTKFVGAQHQGLDAEARQAVMARVVHRDPSMIAPSDYFRDDYGDGNKQHMTTVGMRIEGRWRFFTQRYVINNTAKTCKLLDFQEFETNNA